MRRLLCLALLACTLGRPPAADAQDSPGFFVEIEPARSTFFTGDHFSVRVLSTRGELAHFIDVEILAEDRWWRPPVDRLDDATGHAERRLALHCEPDSHRRRDSFTRDLPCASAPGRDGLGTERGVHGRTLGRAS